jgi:hypothetical protein
MQAAYQDIASNVRLSRKQWVCLLGMYFLTNNDASSTANDHDGEGMMVRR